ncbi:hypothetical protein EXT68_02945 [Pectobacterium parmentieri]|uniref:Uncharacterized protein n=1 Tax=Pectobacterium parmentieri TaxID=1905730 RepID=A0A0H3I6X2_PECPM|nr:hypothetical protein [Pectobacterium parmentieri]AFI89681.1 Hypothetical protein W5S_1589 [Pectobacterium parmentieri]MBI0472100.1 hypothetical protein [Pectobacterium parmentieri]MBI0495867.1 hypothetical protein [Pectobacterium parmentieri]MBI0556261.1 hypothetical protein [Pectobacterium parmentieri]MBI0569345.1 hypothetical protein [Pectobacterium parmentieri]
MSKNEERIDWHLQVKSALLLMLSVSALPAMASEPNLKFNTAITVSKERPCELNITPKNTLPPFSYEKNESGGNRFRAEGGGNIKIDIDAIGENECTIGKLEISMQSVDTINGITALILKNRKGYIPFDYALGESFVQTKDGKLSYAMSRVSRKSKYGSVIKASEYATLHGKAYRDIVWHNHSGRIPWISAEDMYAGDDHIPFWLSPSDSATPVIIDSSDVRKLVVNIKPAYSVYPYNTDTQKRDDNVVNAGDTLENTAVFTFTSV